MQRPGWVGCVVTQQVEDAPVLERRRAPAMLLQRRTTKRVQEDFQRGVGADFMQGLALVLEDLDRKSVV